MTRLFLVRHGPTHAKTMVGWSDLPADLSDKGAITRLAAQLPEQACVISSDLVRATATADAVQGTRRRLASDPALREINFGDWELHSHAEIEASDPELARAYWDNPGDVRPPNGETWHEVCARVDAAIDHLTRAHPGGDLIVVAHFGVILSQLQRALRLDPGTTFAQRIDNLSLSELTRLGPDDWQVGRINHLA